LAVDPFGLSWSLLFRCENLDSRALDSLGFPWILSSESRLFSGLREIFVREFLLSLFPVSRIAETGARGRGMQKRRIAHPASLNQILLFRNKMLALIAIAVGRVSSKSECGTCGGPEGVMAGECITLAPLAGRGKGEGIDVAPPHPNLLPVDGEKGRRRPTAAHIALAVDRVSSKSEWGTRGSPEGVMVGERITLAPLAGRGKGEGRSKGASSRSMAQLIPPIRNCFQRYGTAPRPPTRR
jgi:hypothetical protein